MRIAAIALMLVALMLMLGSCVPFVFGVIEVITGEEIYLDEAPVAIDETRESPVIDIVEGNQAKLSLKIRISTDSVQETSGDGSTKYQARYRFPVRFSVRDPATQKTLEAGTAVISWTASSKTTRESHVDSHGGRLTIEQSVINFDVPDSRRIIVRTEVETDSTYGARAESIVVKIYRSDSAAYEWLFIIGGIMLFASLLLLVVGIIMGGISSRTVKAETSGEAGEAIADRTKQVVSWCHISGLFGYVIPFAGIIVPLTIWLTQRDIDPFIDDQGKEAVNFQISVFLYLAVSALLMLVLVGFVLIFAVTLAHIILCIIAAVNTSQGEPYRYPLTIRLIR